ncbi:MAG: hypothetical protein CSA65_00710 [Proteobacteria bacterium]|nr:MAG: hypothetical protein CSA65_00710 [Pseudomonadota bacterium]
MLCQEWLYQVTSPPLPFSIGRYRCVRRLGSGCSGTTYLATGPGDEQWVAKRLHPRALADPNVADALLHALSESRYLHHENCVPLRELIEVDGDPYLISEYIEGHDLSSVFAYMRYHGLPSPAIAVNIVAQVCEGLAHAHHLVFEGRSAQMLHGALWPTNVLLDERGLVRVRDFGSWHPVLDRCGDEDSFGAPQHDRSPEHLRGEELTRATDVFGVGALLYQLLAGHGLFEGHNPLDVLRNARGGTLGSMEQVPLAFRSLLRRCLAIDPRRRPGEARALAADLVAARPGAAEHQIRAELASYLAEIGGEASSSRRESLATTSVAGSAPLPALAALDPRAEFDEPTSVNPLEVNKALVDMTRDVVLPDALPPGAPGQLAFDDDDEPTAVKIDDSSLPLFDDDDGDDLSSDHPGQEGVDDDTNVDGPDTAVDEGPDAERDTGLSWSHDESLPEDWDEEATEVAPGQPPGAWPEDDANAKPSANADPSPNVDASGADLSPAADEDDWGESTHVDAFPKSFASADAAPAQAALEPSWEPSVERSLEQVAAEESESGVWDSISRPIQSLLAEQPNEPFDEGDESSTAISAPPRMGSREVIQPERALIDDQPAEEESTIRAGRMSIQLGEDTRVSPVAANVPKEEPTRRYPRAERHDVASHDPSVDSTRPLMGDDSMELTLQDAEQPKSLRQIFEEDRDELTLPRSDGGLVPPAPRRPAITGPWPARADAVAPRRKVAPAMTGPWPVLHDRPFPQSSPVSSLAGSASPPAAPPASPSWPQLGSSDDEVMCFRPDPESGSPAGVAAVPRQGGRPGEVGRSPLRGSDGRPIQRVPLPGAAPLATSGPTPRRPFAGTLRLPAIADNGPPAAPYAPTGTPAGKPPGKPAGKPPGRPVGKPPGTPPLAVPPPLGAPPAAALGTPEPPPLAPPPGSASPTSILAPEQGSLSFQPAAEAPGYHEDLYSGGEAALKPKRRWGWAHLVLGAAIVIFATAVGLLIHKLVKRSRAKDAALVTDGGLAKGGEAGLIEKGQKGDMGKGNGDTGKGGESKGGESKGGESKGDTGEGDTGEGDTGKGGNPRRPRGPIRVVSRPPATLYVNGRKIGKTPQTLRRRQRPRVLAIVTSKYAMRVDRIDGMTPKTLSFDLQRVRYPRYTGRTRAHLVVRCRDRRLDRRRVILDGKDTGFSCPMVGFYVRPGRYKVGLRSLRTGEVTVKKVRLRRRQRKDLRFGKERRRRGRRRR